MVEAYLSAMGGHHYISFPDGILCQLHHQLCLRFQSGSKDDLLVLGTQAHYPRFHVLNTLCNQLISESQIAKNDRISCTSFSVRSLMMSIVQISLSATSALRFKPLR